MNWGSVPSWPVVTMQPGIVKLSWRQMASASTSASILSRWVAGTPADSQASTPTKWAMAEPHMIAEVMDWARKRIATLSGVRTEAVKLDCRTET